MRNELREGLKSQPLDDDLLDMIGEAVRREVERTTKLTQSKTADVSMVAREKNDFQRDPPKKCLQQNEVKKRDNLFEKMEEMRINHKNEMGSLRAELCEIKNVFKNGFSNLSTNQPPANIQPLPPASGNCSPSFGQSGGFSNSSGQFSLSVAPPAQQQNQQYVIPQMRSQPINNGQPPSLMQNNNFVPNNQNNYLNRPPNRRFFGCTACVSSGARCTHCLFCGRGGHQISGCPVRESAALRNGGSTPVTPAPGAPAASGNNGSAGNC